MLAARTTHGNARWQRQ